MNKINLGETMKTIILVSAFFISLRVFADENISVKVESMANTSGNGSIEACGNAVHKDGKRPLVVTLKHDQSYYTTLTAVNDKWCVLFKRWTYSGKIDVSATTLDQSERSETHSFKIKSK